MEEKMSDQDYQRGEKEQNCCRFFETRDKDMTEFYIIRVGGDKIEHPIEKIAKNPQDYKYCNQCGKINRQGNERCHACGHRNFNGMDNEDSRDLLLDWEKEPDFLMEV